MTVTDLINKLKTFPSGAEISFVECRGKDKFYQCTLRVTAITDEIVVLTPDPDTRTVVAALKKVAKK